MSLMNIAGTQSVDDPEYRYKMPRLLAKIEGRGNGIKTLVVNCQDIATSLHRSTAEVCKFFGCELGAQSKYDEKTDRAIVNGAFEASMMQTHLSNKDKDKDKKKKEKKEKKAKDEPEKEESGAPKEKKEKKEKSSSSSKDKDKDKSEKKDKKDKKDRKEKKEKKPKAADDDDDDVEWHTDLSPEAVAARAAEAEAIEVAARAAMAAAEEEAEVVATLDNLQVDDENAMESAVANLQRFLATPGQPPAAIFEELCRQQTYAALPITDRLVIFFRSAFTGAILASNQVAKYAPVLEQVIDSAHSQHRLLALCEHFCAVAHPELTKSFPILLKLLYDEELLEEDVLLGWAAARKEFAHWEVTAEQAATLLALLKPFTEWLENAEEESGSDDDDE
ncbi:hypothetical protein PybrP1_005542 [[Pythium] brassicae (nom. inval.)]|nr:hypothetical protein PybrP1_005542 [[Pythium] brassicae (nom. inval.)]